MCRVSKRRNIGGARRLQSDRKSIDKRDSMGKSMAGRGAEVLGNDRA